MRIKKKKLRNYLTIKFLANFLYSTGNTLNNKENIFNYFGIKKNNFNLEIIFLYNLGYLKLIT